MKKIIFILSFIPSFLNAQNLVKNGDFERGSLDFTSQYKLTSCRKDSNGCSGGAFICNGTYAIVREPSACNADWSAKYRDHTSGNGKMLIVDFSSRQLTIWQQIVDLEEGATYKIKFWGLNLTEVGARPSVHVLIDSVALNPNFIAIKNEWQPYEAVFTAKKAGLTPIRIKNISNIQIGCDMGLDDISLEMTKKGIPKKKSIPKILPIQWETAKAILKKESRPILDSVALVLQKNQTLKLTIISHTDTRGNDNDNLILSEKRSKAVVDYLIKKGIQPARLTPKGVGEMQPLTPCNQSCTDAEHRQNRRTEFLLE